MNENIVVKPVVVLTEDGRAVPVTAMVETGEIEPEQALAIISAFKGQGLLLFAVLLGLLALLIVIAASIVAAGIDGTEAGILLDALTSK